MRHRRAAAGIALLAVLVLLPVSSALAQQTATAAEAQRLVQQQLHQQRLQQIFNDKAGFVAQIVQRWETAAREGGRWDENYTTDMTNALMKLLPENLAAVAEASSFAEVMRVLGTGSRGLTQDESGQVLPNSLGDTTDDLVFTPLTPCRIVDTRYAGGAISGGTRYFDADNTTSFAFQGGNAGPCGLPYGAGRAIAATITVTDTVGSGWITAWGGGSMPLASVINYTTNTTVANTTVIPIVPGAGNDFSIYSAATADVIIDVVGYYAPPVATAVSTYVVSATTTAAASSYFAAYSGTCPTGYYVTGGGFRWEYYQGAGDSTMTSSWPTGNQWLAQGRNNLASAQNIVTYAVCTRVPGR
jgi:hypothetical protein